MRPFNPMGVFSSRAMRAFRVMAEPSRCLRGPSTILETWTFGVGIRWQVHEHVSIDLAYKRYLMQGLDDVTLSAAYPQANVFTMGIGFQW
jgi:opacity protein-like surface antigen